MENKKTKLTISGTTKKSIKNIGIAKTSGKKTVVIEKPKNNLTVIRSKAYASNRKTFFKKIFHYTVFAIGAILNFRKVKLNKQKKCLC